MISKIDCTSIPENKKWAMGQQVKALPTFLLFKVRLVHVGRSSPAPVPQPWLLERKHCGFASCTLTCLPCLGALGCVLYSP